MSRLSPWLRGLGLVLSLFPVVRTARCEPPLTTIEDVLYKADGTRFQGLAMVEWKDFEASDKSKIATHRLAVKIERGFLKVRLVPTTDASAGAYYSVRYSSDGRIQFSERWAVPPSATPLRVRDVRVATSSGSVVPPPAEEQIQIADVVGLANELSLRVAKGVGYANSRAAVIASDGTLEAAGGAPGDCVRVDGTAGPCGVAGEAEFVDAETPAGTVDGVNASFTLAGAPNPASSLLLFRNGMLQKQGFDYLLEGSAITFATSAVPQSGDTLLAGYRTAVAEGGLTFVDGETPSGTLDGVNRTFTLAWAPSPAGSLLLFRNGLLQKPGQDYTLSGGQIQFEVAATPQTQDTLLAFYRY